MSDDKKVHSQAQNESTSGMNINARIDTQPIETSPRKEASQLPAIALCPKIPRPETFPDQPSGRFLPLPPTPANVQYLLAANNVQVVYNTIKKKTAIFIPDFNENSDNADNSRITLVCGLCSSAGMSIGQVPAIIELLGDSNPYNPVQEWILSKPWDEVDRLPLFYATLTMREDFPVSLKETCMRKWMLSAVAAVLTEQGFRTRGVLVLQGPQGLGKTTWLQSLVPDMQLRDAVVKVDHHLDANSKDSVLSAISHWLVEIGELDSSFKKDVARLKGFLTSNADKVRKPYARTESEYARRTVFFATVNDANFLVDHTGNTRWWTLPVTAVNYSHHLDMQQIFAQLTVAFRSGDQWWLTDDEERLLEQHNQDHRSNSVLRELLLNFVDLDAPINEKTPYLSTTELFREFEFKNPKNADAKEMTSILRELFGDPKKVKGTMKWRIPKQRDSRDPFWAAKKVGEAKRAKEEKEAAQKNAALSNTPIAF